ncbi:MAG: proline iminopeptidase-family hydrolase [Cytophagaceae bacterium]|nr:proline iminopeptidase-family hydrolase [Gemmatimonadaceae bacterium]
MRACSIATAACLVLAAGCASPRPDEGFIGVEGGRVWYHRAGTGPGTPLLLLHGGPGSCSYYQKPLLALSSDRPVIIYDQLGCGKSDRVTDTTLFTVDRFVRELQAVRDSLGLREVHLLGHSWGSMLAAAYMGTNPTGVKSLIMSSPLVTTAQWELDADSLIRRLPDSIQVAIASNEAAHTTDSPAYAAAMQAFYREHLQRRPPQRPVDDDSGSAAFSKVLYEYMWGPSEFTSTGTLKTFDSSQWLKRVNVPALFMTGEFDEATPASTRRFSALVSGAEFAVIPGSGHMTQNDNLDAVLSTIRGFLARVEGR